jgi:superfamily II DNA or RNA helicase
VIQLRDYQVVCIERVRRAIRAGKRRIMLTIPTGGGKTFTAASIIAGALAKGKRSLFVAHRLELIDQTVASFARVGITSVGVIRAGDRRTDASQPIQVASIQTLARRTQQDVDLVVIDEAHRGVAESYTEHLFERHAGAVIIGLSATPVRSDGRPLGLHFDELVVGARYSELIAGGSIVEPRVYSTPVLPDMTTVRTSGGDYNHGDLEAAMNRGALIGDIFEQWSKHARQRTVAFAVSVAHSHAIVEMFRSHGVRAEHLDGNTPEDERRAILARLGRYETELVSNVGVLCEGWDLPSCKTLIVARPTKSLALWMQMAGRILRPHEGATPLVLDHGGNVDRHGLPHEDRDWSLDAKPKRGSGAPPVKACPKCFAFIAAGVKACPHCGHTLESSAPEPSQSAEPVIVDLALRTLEGDDAKLAFYRALHRKCRDRGWKYGAVIHRFEERFGEPPPASWIAALKSDYRNDTEWKGRVTERRREAEAADRAAFLNGAPA